MTLVKLIGMFGCPSLLNLGFSFVKELTQDVQNVIAPSKEQFSHKVETPSTVEGQTGPASPHADENKESPSSVDAHVMENGVHHDKGENGTPRSAPESPAAQSSVESPPRDFPDLESSAMFDRDTLRYETLYIIS